jgi:hypothetical protein
MGRHHEAIEIATKMTKRATRGFTSYLVATPDHVTLRLV